MFPALPSPDNSRDRSPKKAPADIHTVSKKNHVARLKELLHAGVDPDQRDLSVHGNKSWVALDNVTGDLFFSQDGNFAANAEQIGNINFVGNDPTEFLSNRNVNVVA